MCAAAWTTRHRIRQPLRQLSGGKFAGRGGFLQLQQISKNPFVSVNLGVFHSDGSENQQHQTQQRSFHLTGDKGRQTNQLRSPPSRSVSNSSRGEMQFLHRGHQLLSGWREMIRLLLATKGAFSGHLSTSGINHTDGLDDWSHLSRCCSGFCAPQNLMLSTFHGLLD